MDAQVDLSVAYVPSDDVVARQIEDEIIIVPLTSGIGDLEGALFTLNETGREVWSRLAPDRPVTDIIASLCGEFEGSAEEIQADVVGFMEELLKRGIITRA